MITGAEFRVFGGIPRWEVLCVDEGQRRMFHHLSRRFPLTFASQIRWKLDLQSAQDPQLRPSNPAYRHALEQ